MYNEEEEENDYYSYKISSAAAVVRERFNHFTIYIFLFSRVHLLHASSLRHQEYVYISSSVAEQRIYFWCLRFITPINVDWTLSNIKRAFKDKIKCYQQQNNTVIFYYET
jgi:hypothetical protein